VAAQVVASRAVLSSTELVSSLFIAIPLLNMTHKVFSIAKKSTGNFQCGFRLGNSASDLIHSIRQAWGEDRSLTHHMFVDIKAVHCRQRLSCTLQH
jgi:hypothetical protein